MNIIEAIHSQDLFKPCFRDLKTWGAWFTLLKALFGLQMDENDLRLYQACTGREKPPEGPFKELWAIIGRRGGKSFISAVVAIYLALFYDYSKYLSFGERGVIQVIASDRAQSQVILGYVKGILHSNPILKQYIETELKESIDLTNNISIEVMSCSFRAIRGRTVVAGLCDEISFWRAEGASPDREILAAVRPGMSTIPNSLLIVISSPYARQGVLYEHHREYFGKPDPEILVWRAPTRVMNPTISQGLIDREIAKDPAAARAEWQAEFREDIEDFLNLQAVELCCILPGELAPEHRYVYRAFSDPSGGRGDAFTLAIGHQFNGKLIVDLLRAWKPPFNPDDVTREISGILGKYSLNTITGDRYGGLWVPKSFEKHAVRYEPCERPKSDLYLSLEGYINTQQIELPRNKELIRELVGLERRRGRSGRDVVDHFPSPKSHDDLANAIAGVCYCLTHVAHGFFSQCDLS